MPMIGWAGGKLHVVLALCSGDEATWRLARLAAYLTIGGGVTRAHTYACTHARTH